MTILTRRRTALAAIVALAATAIIGAACATSQKQRAVVAYQSAQTALGVFQDTERALYQARTLPELTDERHRAISAALARAFDVQIQLGNALLIWRTGEPAPTSVVGYLNEADRVIQEVQRLLPDDSRVRLARDIVQWARTLVELAKQFKVTAPASVEAAARTGQV